VEQLEAIPQDWQEPARTALSEAFGRTPVTALERMRPGASGALIYRIEAGGRAYLLRLEATRDLFRDPQRGYVCMRTAAEADVAPPLLHADPSSGVAILAFVESRPLSEFPGGPLALARALGALVRRLQATPAFPAFAAYPVLLERMLMHLRASELFAPGLLDAHAESFERIRDAYPWASAAHVSSHNDPNPGNLLFDGERLWLIDWETAFRNDRMADLAIVAEWFATAPGLEDALLEGSCGHRPDRTLRACLHLMIPLTRLYYACILLGMSIGRHATETGLDAPTKEELRIAAQRGELVIGAPETLHVLGKRCLRDFLDAARAPALEEARVIARQG
jgi:hypothetical protein